MTVKVLITRDINACAATANAVKALGFTPILNPLIKIEPISYELPADFEPSYIIITSINAAKAIVKEQSLLHSPFLVVGEKSAKYLSSHRFNVDAVYPDSDALLSSIKNHAPVLKFLYLSGEHVASDIPASLTRMGHNTRRIIVYESKKVEEFDSSILSDINIITFYSPRTAKIFQEHITTGKAHSKLSNIMAICLSNNVASALSGLTFKNIKIAKTPKEEEMLALLKL